MTRFALGLYASNTNFLSFSWLLKRLIEFQLHYKSDHRITPTLLAYGVAWCACMHVFSEHPCVCVDEMGRHMRMEFNRFDGPLLNKWRFPPLCLTSFLHPFISPFQNLPYSSFTPLFLSFTSYLIPLLPPLHEKATSALSGDRRCC